MARRSDWFIAAILAAASVLGWNLAEEDVAWGVHVLVDTNTTDDFEEAKIVLYNDVDREPNDTVRCRYSNTFVNLLQRGNHLWPDADGGVDAEHTWSSNASWGSPGVGRFVYDSEAGADLHNLFPTRPGINRSRGNHRFGNLPDGSRQLWVDTDGTLSNPGQGTASGSFRDWVGDTVFFEPRDDHKGDVARAMFYMSVRYWWEIPRDMERTLRQWHVLDPPDDAERARNDRVFTVQDNRNPFVVRPRLVDDILDF